MNAAHCIRRDLGIALCGVLLVACGSSSVPQTGAPSAGGGAVAPATAQIDGERIVIGNGLVERRWTRKPYRTEALTDLRTGRVWTQDSADIALGILGLEVIDRFEVSGEPQVETQDDGTVRVTTTLVPSIGVALPLLRVIRTVELTPGIAGLRHETRLESLLPFTLSSYWLDRSTPGETVNADLHSFRAGADWREPEWDRPPLTIGDPQGGTWRKTTSGTSVYGTAQWLSLSASDGSRLFYVLERNDWLSSVTGFQRGRAQAGVDFGRDVIYLGPLEESLHIGNPGSGPGRHRVLLPGQTMRLEPVFTGVALNADDEPWQHHRYFERRTPPYRREVTFNSNGVDDNAISTGAKDDMDYAMFETQLAVADRMGVEMFIFDDGWQARSGDWCPDADVDDERCVEPRRGTDPKFAPRFPDAEFKAVRERLAPLGMKLGLWMSPLHFHPSSVAFRESPEWMCLPISAALLLVNQADPESSSSEAGIVQWNPEGVNRQGKKAIDHIEERIRVAIEQWGVRYFKFDFTAWFDCVGVNTVDLYAYRESFRDMLDRVLADHPDVTIQMDETNDYRLFPFEALVRGPTWYQNGSPEPRESLHANWVLTPYIAPYALGRAALRSGDLDTLSADYQMAIALLSHITFFNDLRDVPEAAIPRIRVWMDYYKRHRAHFATFTYPLLDEDPYSGDNWAAFQPWNPETGRGALLVYRQDAEAARRTVKLRNVPDGRYRLIEAPDDTRVLEYDAQQLRAGIDIDIAQRNSARVFRIERR
jgi:hypothetical protein